MRKTIVSLLASIFLCALAGTTSVIAKQPAEQKPEKAVAGEKKAKATAAKPETIIGSVVMVVKEEKLLVLEGTGGVPYNFKVTPATQIKVGEKKGNFDDLAGLINKRASVKFVPVREGNLAQSIEIQP
ncbi:MAG TPA: hypothetical protein VEU11_10655 [Terriglobales bacterium]|nr:hypothetical protein [Terriglobales bacterium]